MPADLVNSADLLPMAGFHAWVTDGCQNRKVLLKLINLIFEAFGHTKRSTKIRESLGQLMHGPPHDVQLI